LIDEETEDVVEEKNYLEENIKVTNLPAGK
jgi:hypothetical protein